MPVMSPWTGNISRTTSSHQGDTLASAMLAATVNDAFLADPQDIFIGFSLLFEVRFDHSAAHNFHANLSDEILPLDNREIV